MKNHTAVFAVSCALAISVAQTATFAKVPSSMMDPSGSTTYSFQGQDVDGTNGSSGLLTLTALHNGVVKVDEAGNAAYSDVKNLGHGSAQTGVGAGTGAGTGQSVGNLQPDGTIQVIPEGRVMSYYNFLASVLAAGPDHPKTGDTWNTTADLAQSTGQALLHLAVTAKVTQANAGGTTITFDGSGDDKLSAGRAIIAIKVRAQTHMFGTLTIVKNAFQTAEGETDTTMMHNGHNEKWSLKRA